MKELNPFILHSSLDLLEDVQWTSNSLYLKTIDNFYNYPISAFLTPGNIKFLLLHESRGEDSIKGFFNEMYDLYVKTLMNPFYKVDEPIKSKVFDSKVKALAKKYL